MADSEHPPAHESIRPGEIKKKHVRVDKSGGSLSPRGWAVLLGTFVATVIGGGGYTGLRLVTQSDVEQTVKAQTSEMQKAENGRHSVIDNRLDNHDKTLKGFTVAIGRVAKSQHREEASQEAHRLTSGIRDRIRREREYERLRRINEDRLAGGGAPCYNLACNN